MTFTERIEREVGERIVSGGEPRPIRVPEQRVLGDRTRRSRRDRREQAAKMLE